MRGRLKQVDFISKHCKQNVELVWTSSYFPLFQVKRARFPLSPHISWCLQFVDKGNNGKNNSKNNRLPSGPRLCFRIVGQGLEGNLSAKKERRFKFNLAKEFAKYCPVSKVFFWNICESFIRATAQKRILKKQN